MNVDKTAIFLERTNVKQPYMSTCRRPIDQYSAALHRVAVRVTVNLTFRLSSYGRATLQCAGNGAPVRKNRIRPRYFDAPVVPSAACGQPSFHVSVEICSAGFPVMAS